MPELPEVEAVCRRLRLETLGAEIVSAHFQRPGVVRPQRTATLARKIAGRRIEAVRRRGKNILIQLSGTLTLHVHLRMTGNLYWIPDVRFRPVTARAWFELDGGRGLLYDDPRALGRIHLLRDEEVAEALDGVGIEPLSAEFTAAEFRRLAAASRQPIKIFLLDQRHVAGIGNIYAAEALFRARINPRRPATQLRPHRLNRLHAAIVEILTEAVESAYNAYMAPGRFQEAEWFPLRVYGREGQACEVCGREIRRFEQGGRSTYHCPTCQR